MTNIDLKSKLRNKTFWVAMTSAIAMLAEQLGLNIIPSNYIEIVNTVLMILTMVGIVSDTNTKSACGCNTNNNISITAGNVQVLNPTETKE